MKRVSEVLKTLLANPIIKYIINRATIIDYEKEIEEIIPKNIFDKNPMTICDENGDYVGTTLDMQSMMYHLMKEGIVINISHYDAMRGTVLKEGQNLVSKENRHGKVTGLSCSKEVWTFGYRIKDANVTTRTESSDFRVFNVVDMNGEWYEGWDVIEFVPDKKENEFLSKLAEGNKIVFKDFINKQRRFNIFSFQYFKMKILMNRLNDEIQYLGGLIKMMNEEDIVLPPEEKKVWPEQTRLGNEKKVVVKSVSFEVDTPPLTGEYDTIEFNLDNLKKIIDRKRYLTYTIKSQIQFYLRGEEFAHFKFANPDKPFPHWMQGLDWTDYKTPKKLTVNTNLINKFSGDEKLILGLMKERVYKENEKNLFFEEYEALNKIFFGISDVPDSVTNKVKFTKGRVAFKRLLIFQPGIGEYGVSLLRKDFEKTETVNENYNI